MAAINFRNSQFLISAAEPSTAPKSLPAVLIVGRTNVGKSSLINALLGQKIAFSSKKAGKTKLLNFFEVDHSFYLVDSPGYGSTSYATMSTIHFSKMMEGYLKEPSLKAIVLLLDLRRDMGKDDLAFLDYLRGSKRPLIAILTKVDQMNQKELSLAKKRAEAAGLTQYLLSDLSSKSLEKIRAAISANAKG